MTPNEINDALIMDKINQICPKNSLAYRQLLFSAAKFAIEQTGKVGISKYRPIRAVLLFFSMAKYLWARRSEVMAAL